MTRDSPSYEQVVELEKQLDQRTEILIRKVVDLCMPVRQRNREIWEEFARTCKMPVIGEMYFQTFVSLAGLEGDPEYWKMDWYVVEKKSIEEAAKTLEEWKAADMEHWGNEIVRPCDSSDVGGYYTPATTTRRKCYSRCCGGLGVRAFIADKYDFSSGTAADRLRDGAYVMDMTTKEIVPYNRCNWSTAEPERGIITSRLAKKYSRKGLIYTYRN